MRHLKIKNEADIKQLLALVGESCDNSIMCFNQIKKMIESKGGRMDSSRLVTFYIKCTDKDFPVSAFILDKDNKDNKSGEQVIEFLYGTQAVHIPVESNNITDFKKVVIEMVEEFITRALKGVDDLEIDVDVVGD